MTLALTGVDLLPGEELLCRLEVADNDAYSGSKTTSSESFVVRYPGIEEIVSGEAFEAPLESLEELGEREERLARRMEELAREHRGEERVGAEERRQFRQLAEEQTGVVARAEEVVRRLEDTLNALYEEDLITPESFAKLSEVQGLFIIPSFRSSDYVSMLVELVPELTQADTTPLCNPELPALSRVVIYDPADPDNTRRPHPGFSTWPEVMEAAASLHRNTASAPISSMATKCLVGCAASSTSRLTSSSVMPRVFA